MDSYSHSADYHWIETALKKHTKFFSDLEAEMENFVPRPISDFEPEMRNMRENLRKLNSHMSDESIENHVRRTYELHAQYRIQFSNTFSERFNTEKVVITLLSHALCEATINAIMAIGLAHKGTPELFDALEAVDVRKKWQVGPKSFFPTYNLPKGERLHEALTKLTRWRNSFTHYKITLESKGETLLTGTRTDRLPFQDEAKWIRRFAALPHDLHRHACSQIQSPSLHGVLTETWSR